MRIDPALPWLMVSIAMISIAPACSYTAQGSGGAPPPPSDDAGATSTAGINGGNLGGVNGGSATNGNGGSIAGSATGGDATTGGTNGGPTGGNTGGLPDAGPGGFDSGGPQTIPAGGQPSDPGQVQCNGECPVPSTECCLPSADGGFSAPTCQTPSTPCGGAIQLCNESADCGLNEVCCYSGGTPQAPVFSCVSSGSCTTGAQLCRYDEECSAGQCFVQKCGAFMLEACQALPGCTLH